MALNIEIPSTNQKTGLVVIAHADDLALFVGCPVLMLIDSGWEIHVARVTDDRWDSWGLDEQETVRRNQAEFRDAMEQLGVTQLYELNRPTDRLGDLSEVVLRDEIAAVIRKSRPYLIMTFDPDSIMFEDNEDHRVVGRATSEACWTSGFDKHPDGHVDQLRAHLPIERWYFGRNVVEVTHTIPIAPYRERLIDVVALHKTMLVNMVAQLDLQAQFLGYSLNQLQQEVMLDSRKFAELIVDAKEYQELRVVDASRINTLIERFGEKL